MMNLFRVLRQTVSLPKLCNSYQTTLTKVTSSPCGIRHPASALDVQKKLFHNTPTVCLPRYNPYQEFDESSSPFKPNETRRHTQGFRWKLYDGGPLPRPEGDYEDKPLNKMPRFDEKRKDSWSKAKALYGQNDYIDILGDGTIHPVDLIKAPVWLRGFKGNELQRLIRRMKYEGPMLRDRYPTKFHNMKKQIFYLYKKHNLKRSPAPFWNQKGTRSNRIMNIKDKV